MAKAYTVNACIEQMPSELKSLGIVEVALSLVIKAASFNELALKVEKIVTAVAEDGVVLDVYSSEEVEFEE